jgi:glycosyltransferase involved in cell wall biosynthesis
MKVCMINDICWMGEALSKYLPYDVKRIPRSREVLSKTIGLTARILLAEADLYHVFYVLQDAYLALKLRKKPILGHACGSDVRDTLHSKWGWMVRHNLKNLDYVLSSQPTIVPQIRQYTNKVEYFPIPIDPQLFSASSFPEYRAEFRILYSSPVDFRVKGADKVMEAISLVKQPITLIAIKYGPDLERAYELSHRLGIRVRWIDRQPHSNMAACYRAADIVLGNFGVGQLDTTVIEAMACGRPLVHHLASEFDANVPLGNYQSVEEFADDINRLLADRKAAEQQVQRQLDYVKIHYADRAVKRLVQIYKQVGQS